MQCDAAETHPTGFAATLKCGLRARLFAIWTNLLLHSNFCLSGPRPGLKASTYSDRVDGWNQPSSASMLEYWWIHPIHHMGLYFHQCEMIDCPQEVFRQVFSPSCALPSLIKVALVMQINSGVPWEADEASRRDKGGPAELN